MEQNQQPRTTDKCNCTKPLKALERKIQDLEKSVEDITRQIEVIKRALRGKGV